MATAVCQRRRNIDGSISNEFVSTQRKIDGCICVALDILHPKGIFTTTNDQVSKPMLLF